MAAVCRIGAARVRNGPDRTSPWQKPRGTAHNPAVIPRVLISVAGLLLLAGQPGPALADVGPHLRSGWYLPIGLNLGAAIHPELEHGFLLGGEVSAAFLFTDTGLWSGFYADALWDFGPDSFRFSLGPEMGWGFLGLDVGYTGEVSDGRYHNGLQLRGLITMGFVAVYGRWVHRFGDVTEHDFGEVGLLLKWPIPVGLRPYRPRTYRSSQPSSTPRSRP